MRSRGVNYACSFVATLGGLSRSALLFRVQSTNTLTRFNGDRRTGGLIDPSAGPASVLFPAVRVSICINSAHGILFRSNRGILRSSTLPVARRKNVSRSASIFCAGRAARDLNYRSAVVFDFRVRGTVCLPARPPGRRGAFCLSPGPESGGSRASVTPAFRLMKHRLSLGHFPLPPIAHHEPAPPSGRFNTTIERCRAARAAV